MAALHGSGLSNEQPPAGPLPNPLETPITVFTLRLAHMEETWRVVTTRAMFCDPAEPIIIATGAQFPSASRHTEYDVF